MLVGVLISIMIAIVVGVNLVPTIVSAINTAAQDPVVLAQMPGLSGLLQTLAYVYVAVILLGAVALLEQSGPLKSNLHRTTLRIRGNLEQAIPSQAVREGGWACVTTRGRASLGMVV